MNLRPMAALIALAALPLSAHADNIILVLDESGSMWAQMGGKAKIEIARDAVDALVTGWPAGHQLGLVAYGHRSKGDCDDIETVIPVGPVDTAAFKATVGKLMPKGMTPISAAVIKAAEVLKYSEQKATVLLISDGEETCGLDPCAVGKELEAKGVDFTAHVIGFDVPNPVHQAQLRCLAENTGGRYFNARDARELDAAVGVLATVSTAPALPPATASLGAPDSAAIASQVVVTFEGPLDDGDYIAIASPSQKPNEQVAYVTELVRGKPAAITMPSTPGDYELRYVSPRRENAVLARRPIVATELAAAITAPATAMAGSNIEVVARGPNAPSHWIGFAPKGSGAEAYLDWKRPTGDESRITLQAPAQVGDYEVRYVLNEHERILASQAVKVVEPSASIEAPAEVGVGETITVKATGPFAQNHWIGFAPKGSDAGTYLDWKRPTDAVSEIQLQAPGTAGDYELRFVLNEHDRILVSRPIKVIAASASIEAPAEVAAGDLVHVVAHGPMAANHWIGFAPKGSEPGTYLDWKRPTGATTEIDLSAPTKAGEYELRYVLNEHDSIAAFKPIKVTPPNASISAPDTAVAGTRVSVTATGPVGGGHWIGFAPKGSGPEAYLDYQRPTGPTSVVTLATPDQPGEYEIRYILNEREVIAASKPIRITPAN